MNSNLLQKQDNIHSENIPLRTLSPGQYPLDNTPMDNIRGTIPGPIPRMLPHKTKLTIIIKFIYLFVGQMY